MIDGLPIGSSGIENIIMGLIAQDMHDVGRTFNDARSIAPSNDGREKPSNFDVFFGFKLFGDLYRVESKKIRVVLLL